MEQYVLKWIQKKKDTLYIYIDLLTLVPTELRFFSI